MPLELRKNPDGTVRPFWYGRYEINGKRHCDNLGIKIAGTPPASLSLRHEGDGAFERSRATALAKLEHIISEARSTRDSSHLVEKLYEIKTGEPIRSIALSQLPSEWETIPRRRKPNARYARQCQATLARFADYIREQNPSATELAQVTRPLVRSFMDAEANRGITSKTWNDTLKLLRATFKHLMPAGAVNPFHGIPTREVETVFRKPFSPEELKAIIEAAQKDAFIYPVIIIGIFTAMRRGDCCQLKWRDVDLANRFITVKTNKTGQNVSIPVFMMLYDVLSALPRTDAFVLPEQAAMYQQNPDGITWRVRKVFADAGFKDATVTPETGAKGGKVNVHRGEIHAGRSRGMRRASVRDFHSFRVTWVTLALTGGVPLELVQKVTGHKTTDIVLKHYFQPGQEAFRHALQNAMPNLLTDGQELTSANAAETHPTPIMGQVQAIAAQATQATAWHDIKTIRSLLAG